jgi:hypothetical protein
LAPLVGRASGEWIRGGLQQALEFRIAGGRNERSLKRAIDGLVISHLIGNVSLVELRATELRQFSTFLRRLLG